MHPELRENAIFVKYYKMWQKDPSSIVFASIAEYFLLYGMVEDAIRVCEMGLKYHPHFVAGCFALAKAYFKRGDLERASTQLQAILKRDSSHAGALEILQKMEGAEKTLSATRQRGEPMPLQRPWQTLTMAKIYESQGHTDAAKEIYEAILETDPGNVTAKSALEGLRNPSGQEV